MQETPLNRALEKVGGATKLAGILGMSRMAIYKWHRNRIPAERVLEIERITGVSRHELRPDIYPRDE